MATDRVKLGETPLVSGLRHYDVSEGREHRNPDYENAGLLFYDGYWRCVRLTPAGEALLLAAPLWDSLPEADEYLIMRPNGDPAVGVRSGMLRPSEALAEGLQTVANALEAQRRAEGGHP